MAHDVDLLKAKQAFNAQRSSARARGIDFLFTFEEWWEWWMIDGNWKKRGLRKNGRVMARFGDKGPYASWNVYCATPRQNTGDIDAKTWNSAIREGWATKKETGYVSHLCDRESHPGAKPVMTPRGVFPSAALAAEAHGIARRYAQTLANRERNGWRYLEKPVKATKGKENKRDRAIVTPDGWFKSSAAAAPHYGVSRQTAYLRARKRERGWFMANKPLTPEELESMLPDYPKSTRLFESLMQSRRLRRLPKTLRDPNIKLLPIKPASVVSLPLYAELRIT